MVEGLIVGQKLRDLVGLDDGLLEGRLVNDSDGESVGPRVGMFVGMELGSLEGVIIGSDDGFTDGTVVVGVSVGANDEV